MARSHGAKTLSICNVVDSSIARGSDAVVYNHARPEIGVASTKAFTAQLTVLLLLAFAFGRKIGTIDAEFVEKRVEELLELPGQMEKMLLEAGKIRAIAERYAHAPQVLYIARGVHFPVALEGALKLKEISYMHAEGFAAGELKHGPIALVDDGTPVIALAPQGYTFEKIMNNIEEVRARGADLVLMTNKEERSAVSRATEVIHVPHTSWYTSPILYALPLQLFAYYIADHKGTDVDQPRNLAKSVTVE
jgi:glucosamine--fructose-6-phosphate aminotransferase (isomerizing)